MDPFPKILILPPVTICGHGAVAGLAAECAEFGGTGMLVHGASLRKSGALSRVADAAPGHLRLSTFEHDGGEPDLDQVEAVRMAARNGKVEWIAAVGGGSVIDVAKAAAGLLDAPRPAAEYHDGAAIPPSRLPFIAAPTTAGTGSEATTVTVLTNRLTGVKKSIRHASFLPRKVILDPDLLRSCPGHVLAASGMDAFTQSVESFLSRYGTWLTRTVALESAVMVRSALPQMFERFEPGAAERLLYGSYLAGIALSNARLGLVHGLAHPLGARCGVPHGLACAVCLPPVLDFNRPAAPDLFRELGGALGGDPAEVARGLLARLRLASPFSGREPPDLPGIVEETMASGSTAANARDVSAADVERIVRGLFAAAA